MELVLPSSPVWYQTKASDTSFNGYFAFASRCLIYLLDIRQDLPLYYGDFLIERNSYKCSSILVLMPVPVRNCLTLCKIIF